MRPRRTLLSASPRTRTPLDIKSKIDKEGHLHRLQAFLAAKKIVKKYQGGFDGSACTLAMGDNILSTVDTMLQVDQALSITQSLREFKDIYAVISNTSFKNMPAVIDKLRMGDESFKDARTFEDIVGILRMRIFFWIDDIQENTPGYGLQDYHHLLLHVPDLMLRDRGIGLFTSAGVEALHKLAKRDLVRHRSGRVTMARHCLTALRRSLWRVDERFLIIRKNIQTGAYRRGKRIKARKRAGTK